MILLVAASATPQPLHVLIFITSDVCWAFRPHETLRLCPVLGVPIPPLGRDNWPAGLVLHHVNSDGAAAGLALRLSVPLYFYCTHAFSSTTSSRANPAALFDFCLNICALLQSILIILPALLRPASVVSCVGFVGEQVTTVGTTTVVYLRQDQAEIFSPV